MYSILLMYFLTMSYDELPFYSTFVVDQKEKKRKMKEKKR